MQKALLQPEAVQWRREKALHSDGFCHFLSRMVSNFVFCIGNFELYIFSSLYGNINQNIADMDAF